MIIGHGTIASALVDNPNITFFASGVSNSQETDESAYRREMELLMDQSVDKKLVYFSSLAVFYEDTRYTKHKRRMEDLVRSTFPSYCIVRIGLAAWGSNPHTLINKVRGQVQRGEAYQVYPVFRYVVDEEQFRYWVGMIPSWNCEMNITGTKMSAREIIDKYVHGGS